MNPETALVLLKRHRAELLGLGVVSLSIVGSTARGEATGTSDVDVAVTLAEGLRGFAHFRRMDRLRTRLTEILGRPVDVIEEPSPSTRVQREINRDRVLAF